MQSSPTALPWTVEGFTQFTMTPNLAGTCVVRKWEKPSFRKAPWSHLQTYLKSMTNFFVCFYFLSRASVYKTGKRKTCGSPVQDTGGKHKDWGLNLALHLVLSGPAPCFYPAAAPSPCLTVKEQLQSYSPKITFSPLKATVRLMWPPVKMSLALRTSPLPSSFPHLPLIHS